MEGNQRLGLNLTSSRLQNGSKKLYGKKKIVKALDLMISLMHSLTSLENSESEIIPVILVANQAQIRRQSQNICISDAPCSWSAPCLTQKRKIDYLGLKS
jgi:hypothetical protein